MPRLMAMAIWPSALESAILYTTLLYGCRHGLHVPVARYVLVCKVLNGGLKMKEYQVCPVRTVLVSAGIPRSTGMLFYTEITGYSPVRHSNLLDSRSSRDTTRAVLLLSTLFSSWVKSIVSRVSWFRATPYLGFVQRRNWLGITRNIRKRSDLSTFCTCAYS